MLEGKFQSRLMRMFERRGAFVFNVHGHLEQKSGMPDLYVSHPMFRGWLELKTKDHQLEPLQEKQIRDLRRTGDVAFAVRLKDGEVTCEYLPNGKLWAIQWEELSFENVVEFFKEAWDACR